MRRETITEEKFPGAGRDYYSKSAIVPAVALSEHIPSNVETPINLSGADKVSLLVKSTTTVTSSTLKLYFYDDLIDTITGGTTHLSEFVITDKDALYYCTRATVTIVHDDTASYDKGAGSVFVGKQVLVG